LKAGEQVVTEGAYGLPDKTKVKIEKPATVVEGKEKASPRSKPESDDKD